VVATYHISAGGGQRKKVRPRSALRIRKKLKIKDERKKETPEKTCYMKRDPRGVASERKKDKKVASLLVPYHEENRGEGAEKKAPGVLSLNLMRRCRRKEKGRKVSKKREASISLQSLFREKAEKKKTRKKRRGVGRGVLSESTLLGGEKGEEREITKR